VVNYAKDYDFSIKKMDGKKKMIITYYPHSKNTCNLKDMEFEIFRNSKYFSNC
jgi:hypothetical protein